MNFKRKVFLNLFDRIERGEIAKLLIAHKHGCEIVVVNQERLSPQGEMVEDLIAIVHFFSSRLYGLRNHKKKIKEASLIQPE